MQYQRQGGQRRSQKVSATDGGANRLADGRVYSEEQGGGQGYVIFFCEIDDEAVE